MGNPNFLSATNVTRRVKRKEIILMIEKDVEKNSGSLIQVMDLDGDKQIKMFVHVYCLNNIHILNKYFGFNLYTFECIYHIVPLVGKNNGRSHPNIKAR